MQGEERPDEDVVGDGGEEQDDSVERDGPGGEMIVAHPCGGERNEREPEEKMEVGPKRRAIDAFGGVKQVMMIVPVDGDEDEAENVAEEDRSDGAKRGQRGALRWLHLEDHDSDDDGEDAVAEGFEAVFGHGAITGGRESYNEKESKRQGEKGVESRFAYCDVDVIVLAFSTCVALLAVYHVSFMPQRSSIRCFLPEPKFASFRGTKMNFCTGAEPFAPIVSLS